ncbi:hypothetical protein LOTGIDRAFT_160924 [Lottia gigantea]|uniref:Uncharacterized protein n=1 Tax=Lottia gigantea TaxID=225164 RepID=V3ZUJ4_LOTGI|nr:hypothetical protein LOTGIDRAFT_160924 [Lottia gigantea]ESO95158.1 hypothetical protein LOTGIDRAFT_160924 [Lottia gigantea]
MGKRSLLEHRQGKDSGCFIWRRVLPIRPKRTPANLRDEATTPLRKGKTKALDIIEKDESGRFVEAFISMGDARHTVDFDVISEFVCCMYAQSQTRDIDEARYNKLMQMTGKVQKDNPLANVKRIDCALLPPTRKTLEMKISRLQYVTVLWTLATKACPGDGLSMTHS